MREKLIKIIAIIIAIRVVFGFLIYMDMKKTIATQRVKADNIELCNIWKIDRGRLAFSIKSSDNKIIDSMFSYELDDDTLAVDFFRTPLNKSSTLKNEEKDLRDKKIIATKAYKRIVLYGDNEKCLWQEGDKLPTVVLDIEDEENTIENKDYPTDTLNEVVYENIYVYRGAKESYTEFVEKKTDEEVVYNYMTNCENSSTITFFVEALLDNGKIKKISLYDYMQKEGNVSNIKIDKKYAKKGTKIRLCVKNGSVHRKIGCVSGKADFR